MKITGNRLVRRVTGVIVLMAMLLATGVAGGNGFGTTGAAAKSEPYVNSEDFIGLRDAYADYFKMGVAMPATNSWFSSDGLRSQTVRKTFNSMTCENEFKPNTNFNSTSPTLYKAGSSGAALLKYCHEHDMQMRYHVLVWHGQINPSIFGKDFKVTSGGKVTTSDSAKLDEECLVDRETLLERLKTYIYGAMEYVYSSGYAQTVYAFDVVNEAVDEGKPNGLRQSYWYQIIGPEFLYYSFLFAREAELTYSKQYADLYGLDPNGDLSSIMPKLFYNDYNEWFSSRVNIIINFTTKQVWNEGQSMVQSFAIAEDGDGTMLGDGLIDGIGMQGHLNDTQNIDEYIRALEKYSEAVGEVHITELDVGCTHSDDNRWYYQSKFYYDFFKRLIEAKENGVNLTSVTIWGLSDDATWRSGSDPTLYNSDLSKKSAYDAVLLAAQKQEFTLTLADTIGELDDLFIDFEPYKDGGKTVFYSPASAGFIARGSGHQPKLDMAPKVNHTPDAVTCLSMVVERAEQDATVMLEASKYSGQNVTFTAYVKTDDKVLRVGLETGQTIPITEISVKEGWNVVSFNYDIPEGLSSVFIYFETDGNADMYIDDVSIIYTREGEEPAPVVVDESSEAQDNTDAQNANSQNAGSQNADSQNAGDTASQSNDTASQSGNTSEEQKSSAASNGNAAGNNKGITKGAVAVAVTAALAAVVVYLIKRKQNRGQ